MQSGQDDMWGMHGQKLRCRRNIAKYQREEGQLLRLLMRACKDTWGPFQAEPFWEQEAFKSEGKWAGIVAKSQELGE
eukprot:4901733-Alexandrium_andersonii.AAC.1